MSFDWTRDLSHIVTNIHFESYTVGETTVDDLMQAYLLRTRDRVVVGHCFRTGFTTLTNKTAPHNSWALGLASPKVIYMAHRGMETDTANTGKLELNFYRISDVVEEGGAYSAGAEDMTGVVAHDPYLTVEIAQVAGYTSTAKPFSIVSWKSDTILVVDTVTDVRAAWRVHEVSMIDGTVVTHTGLFGTGTGSLSTRRNTHALKNGNLAVNGFLKSWIIDTTGWTQLVESDTGNAVIKELSDGTFYWYDFTLGGSKLYNSSLTEIGSLSETPQSNTSLSSIYGSVVMLGQRRSTSGDGDIDEAKRIEFSGTTINVTTFPDYATGRSDSGWGCIVSDDYWMYYNPRRREFSLVSITDGSAHPSIGTFYEVDADIPTDGNASSLGNWGGIQTGTAPAPADSVYWPATVVDGDAITLQFQIQNDDFVESNPVKLVGVSDNDGLPLPLMRASDLEVSSAGATHTFAKLRGVYVPTVDNIVAGTNVTLTKSGADITISSSSGGGGGGSGNISGAYDIEAGEYTDLGLSDEMEGGGLNPAWTVVSGSSGTVDLLGTSSSFIYDLSTREKGLLIQPAVTSGWFEMYASTISSGEQIIFSLSQPSYPNAANQKLFFNFLACTGTPTSYGNYTNLVINANGANLVTYDTTSIAVGNIVSSGSFVGQRLYVRLVRNNDDYYWFVSTDGTAWMPTGKFTNSSISFVDLRVGGTGYTPYESHPHPVCCINWIRHCAYTGYDPW